MSRRFSRKVFLAHSINVGLIAGIGILGCGEARPTEVEPNGTVGTLRALIASYDDHSETFYRLVRDDGEVISLDFGGEDPRVRVGERIAVRGVRTGKQLKVDGYDVVHRSKDEVAQPLTSHAKRNFKIAAITVDTGVTNAKFKSRVFSDPDSPTAFYRDNSYGDWTFEGDVYGPYTITIANCTEDNLWTIAADANAAAKADGFDAANYDNFMYYLPASAGCSWGGIAEVGVSESRGFINAKNSWYRGTGCVVLAQELGHNFGLLHSHKCTATPYSTKTYGGANCGGFSEYGDPYTPMGGGCGHFNAPESAAMGFISGCNTLDVTSSGTFEIGPLEAKCAGPQVIRLSAQASANYGPQYIYLEYHRGMGSVGSDTKTPRGVYFHASAEYGGNHTDIVFDAGHDYDYALDPFYIHDPLSTVDSTWTEPSSGATFKLKAIGDTATVEVTMGDGGAGGTGTAKCIDGTTPPAAPMCAPIVITDAGAPDSGTGGGTNDSGSKADSGGTGVSDAGAETGMGGTAGATGGSAGSGGTAGAGTGGSTTGSANPPEKGCSCSIPGGSSSAPVPALLLGLGALIPALRRRRSRRD